MQRKREIEFEDPRAATLRRKKPSSLTPEPMHRVYLGIHRHVRTDATQVFSTAILVEISTWDDTNFNTSAVSRGNAAIHGLVVVGGSFSFCVHFSPSACLECIAPLIDPTRQQGFGASSASRRWEEQLIGDNDVQQLQSLPV